MADRGTAVAYDAPATPVGVFEHLMEPTASFGGIVAGPYAAAGVREGLYQHLMEPTADFGDQFTGLYYGPW